MLQIELGKPMRSVVECHLTIHDSHRSHTPSVSDSQVRPARTPKSNCTVSPTGVLAPAMAKDRRHPALHQKARPAPGAVRDLAVFEVDGEPDHSIPIKTSSLGRW